MVYKLQITMVVTVSYYKSIAKAKIENNFPKVHTKTKKVLTYNYSLAGRMTATLHIFSCF